MPTPSRKNVMREFRIDEISAVDNPAQQAATMVFMKRQDPETDTRTNEAPVMTDLSKIRSFDNFRDAVDHLRRIHGVEPRKLSKSEIDFETTVDTIQKRDGCSRSDAMSKAARERPMLLKAYQEES